MDDSTQTLSIIPFDVAGDSEPRATFAEVVAYMRGVADALGRQRPSARPLSIVPLVARTPDNLESFPIPITTVPPAEFARLTLRYGDPDAPDPVNVWPRLASQPPAEAQRGGARLLDLESVVAHDGPSFGSMRRGTLPYGAIVLSLAAEPGDASSAVPLPATISSFRPDSAGPADFDRPSGVRLRCAPLSREWYRLTGTDPDG
jgi:hypothetical protein